MSSLRRPFAPEHLQSTGNAFTNPTLSSPRAPRSPYGGPETAPRARWSPQPSPTSSKLSAEGQKMYNQYSPSKATAPTKSPRRYPSPTSYGVRVETCTTTSAESGENKGMAKDSLMKAFPTSPATRRFHEATQKAIAEKRAERETERSRGGSGSRDEGSIKANKSIAESIGGKSISESTISTHPSTLTKGAAPTPPRYPHYAPRDFSRNSPSLADNADNDSVSSNSSQVSRRSLDLMKNDNAFYVIANLLIDCFAACVQNYGDTYLLLDAEDVAKLDKMVPEAVRKSFSKALRYRLVKSCPPDSEERVHILTRQCREFGLDRNGLDNPLLGMKIGYPLTVTDLPPITTLSTTAGRSSPKSSRAYQASPKQAPQNPAASPGSEALLEVENRALRDHLDEQRKQLRAREQELMENASVASVLTNPSVDVNQTESLAKKQLTAELREASTLMAESQTPEASEFWKNHVLGLQSRLKALHAREQQTKKSITVDTISGEEVLQHKQHPISEAGYAPPPYSNNMYAPERKPEYLSPSDGRSPRLEMEPSFKSNASRPASPTKEMINVVSPADLPTGYKFEAEVDGRRFLATVPEGGVKKGEGFQCAMKEVEIEGNKVPTGAWRDRICDCFRFGWKEPLLWNTLLCPLLVLGQVMTRLSVDALGRPLNKRVNAWGHMIGVTLFWVAGNVFIFSGHHYKMMKTLAISVPDYIAMTFLNVCMLAYAIYAVAATRQVVREKYHIREHRCYDLEDVTMATVCLPCTVGQMARHTGPNDEGDYYKPFTQSGVDEETINLEYVHHLAAAPSD
mmetsp:Transcript_32051/g.48739  ORF Transcript_32051/g.48739 Transcript_32051/m.48739 type:complete len:799 (-) Transcript_32051:314-2710(-)